MALQKATFIPMAPPKGMLSFFMFLLPCLNATEPMIEFHISPLTFFLSPRMGETQE
jgi:hypothetical protein